MSKNETGCSGCGFPKLAWRCGGGSGDAETNSQDKNLESKDKVTQYKQELKNQGVDVRGYTAAIISNELQVKIPAPDRRNTFFIPQLKNTPPTAQNEPANKENNNEKKASSPFSIPSPFALPESTRS